MALIATINNKPVYSDKKMKAVINGRVTFTDGSWCDVSTGEVHNAGAGYINIGGTDNGQNSKKITEGPKRVSASALELRGVSSDVQVDVHGSSNIEYTITGPENQVKAILAKVQSKTLVIEGNDSQASGGTAITGSVVMSSVGNITIGSGNVVIGSSGDQSDVKITIKVPRGTPVNSNDVNGAVTIGDTNGPLNAQVKSGSSVSAGHITTAQLAASSSGTIQVKRVDGNVTANASSSGGIRIRGGSMPMLMATAKSSGEIGIDGTAVQAMLDASSSGRVHASHVQQQPMTNQRSSGRVRVGRVG